MSRVEPGYNNNSKFTGSSGSGQQLFKYHGLGRVGSSRPASDDLKVKSSEKKGDLTKTASATTNSPGCRVGIERARPKRAVMSYQYHI